MDGFKIYLVTQYFWVTSEYSYFCVYVKFTPAKTNPGDASETFTVKLILEQSQTLHHPAHDVSKDITI